MDIKAELIKNIFFPLQMVKNRSKILKYLKEYEKSQFLSIEEIKELQWLRLKKLIDYSFKNCPYYKRRFKEVGIEPHEIRSYQDFLNIPVLTKKDIQDNLDDLVAKPYAKANLIRDMTGGSTGSPLIFYYERDRLETKEASRIRHNRWAGLDIGDKVAFLWGAPRDIQHSVSLKAKIRKYILERAILLDASSLSEEKLYSFLQDINTFKPKIIQAYTNVIDIFARFIETNKLSVVRPKGIICTAEVLLPERRKFIESIFKCKIFNRYGSREVALIASECEAHEGLHINAESLYVELVKNNRHVKEGELGEVIITDLLNYGMPLIRYKIGDMARSLGDRACSCGRGLPMIDSVEGRITDFIITPEKKIVSGVALATYMITNIKGIKQVQLVQNRVDSIKIRLVKNTWFNGNSQKELLKRAREFLGENMRIEIEESKPIPNEPSGKFRFSISQISPF